MAPRNSFINGTQLQKTKKLKRLNLKSKTTPY